MRCCCGWTANDAAIRPRSRGATLDTLGWGLFFIWVGTALLLDVGWGIGLLGVGAIILGAQAARAYFGLRLEGFWVVFGSLFSLAGVWELSKTRLSLFPVLLVVVGAALLVSTLRRSRWG